MIERFIGHIARKKNTSYLQFSPSASTSLPAGQGRVPLLMYVHVPFCEELCPYCSFNRIVFQENLARSYFQALRTEVEMYKRQGYDFAAVYVGGGTPTLLMDELTVTLQLIKRLFPIKEISVETNPNHLTPSHFKALQEVGVNRLSVGVQTLDDTLLKAIGRYHKYGSAAEIIGRLRSAQGQFDTLNVDMMFNFPTQTREGLERDVATLMGLGVDQITYYPLMASEYTREVMSRKVGIVDDRNEKVFYNTISRLLSTEYSLSTAWCFSRNDAMIDEYVVNFEEYAGLGSGSIGYLDGTVYANTFDIPDYIRRIQNGSFPLVAKKVCPPKERLRYDFLMKLFGLELDLKALTKKNGVSAYRYLWPEILFFRLTGALTKQGDKLLLTEKGRYYWVVMMREFFIGVNNFRDYCRSKIGASSASTVL
ncbi:MAG TPA: coproporphyrinogen III oxidase family protein [Deltaproteobacteria bacterium]|nr:coproporphyrinogen III oxidase family protein [Deltaproteobacteria bacterium]